MKRNPLVILLVIVTSIIIFHPGRHAKYYDFIPIYSISNHFTALVSKHNHETCSQEFYANLTMLKPEIIDPTDIYSFHNFTPPIKGGEYFPKDCKAIYKTAIIVPYRNRSAQLNTFVKYIHYFLQNQKLHYKIFIVEQNDNLPFNRGKMLNVGANEAIKQNFPCLILHDVDLFPISLNNIYACVHKPRHMSSSIDTFRYNLPYLELSGGAIAIQGAQFQEINGMSNSFDGWGGEDDDFFNRLKAHDLIPERFPPELSKYTMLFHKKARASPDRWKNLGVSLKTQQTDGLNSIPTYIMELKDLYTLLLV